MGLDPESGEYEVGVNHPTCHATLFADETPKYVEIRFNGIDKCPGIFLDPPNRTFLLTQRPDTITWRTVEAPYVATWTLDAAFSRAFIGEGIRIWFLHQLPALCQTFFTNENICLGPINGHNGTAEIFWGPAIHP